jgi:hypothetical protein
MRLRPAHVLAALAFVVVPVSVASAKKCEKNFIEVKLHCDMKGDDRANTLIVASTTTYNYTDPDNGKRKDEYTRPEMHQASVCLGTDNVTIGILIKDRACDAKDIFAAVNYCRLTRAEYEANGKPANLVELCKKLKKPQLFIPAYHFDANKDAKEVINFTTTGVTVDPIK